MACSETCELTLSGMAYGGDAFGRDAAGRAVFVPYALPGEKALVEIIESHRRWARARLGRILEPSPLRVDPPCRHFRWCGGCHYQHMTYQAQPETKAEILYGQLEHLGGLRSPNVVGPVPSPAAFHTRNHMQFSLSPEGCLGLNASQSRDVIPIAECHLPEGPIAALWPRLELGHVRALRRVVVRAGTDGRTMVQLHTDSETQPGGSVGSADTIVWSGRGREQVLNGEGAVTFEIQKRRFRVSAGSFFQVHTALVGELVRLVLQAVEPSPGDTVFDLYAGVGLFSAFLAQSGTRVIAVEASRRACADFEANLAEFDTVELYAGSAERALPEIRAEAKAVVVDPPRPGLSRPVMEELVRRNVPRLVYISCEPPTLARDGRRLQEAGYRLEKAIPIDLFPQTYHIETLSIWSR